MDPLDLLKDLKLPFSDLLGIVFVSADKERVVAELTVREELCTRPAMMHGGAIMAFADTVGAAGAILNLPEGASTTTLESKTNFIAGAPIGARLIGEATPVHRGRRTQVWTTRITTAEGRLVAIVTQTQMVLEARA
jgi:1,4-dihydroxy-2-naphthoyl-CoA hydrolase